LIEYYHSVPYLKQPELISSLSLPQFFDHIAAAYMTRSTLYLILQTTRSRW